MEPTKAERIINRQVQQIASLQFQLTLLQDDLEQIQAENAELKAAAAERDGGEQET